MHCSANLFISEQGISHHEVTSKREGLRGIALAVRSNSGFAKFVIKNICEFASASGLVEGLRVDGKWKCSSSWT